VGINSDFWAQRRVLITGHTGFKGAWLSLWLQSLGAEVTGLAPGPPTRPSLYELARVGANMREHAVDVRNADQVRRALLTAKPEIVLHLAAQPMVRRSLRDPALTYEINVLGTVNVLEAVRLDGEVRVVLVVTSDKCYENPAASGGRSPGSSGGQASRRFVEGDPLGGNDPYSSSKACAELVAAAYRSSFFSAADRPRVATARAGNVLGGGDWGQDRLLGDIARAVQQVEPVRVRNPQAVRPWQHVLNALSGYLLLTEELSQGSEAARSRAARAWNFGPRAEDEQTVGWIIEHLGALWGGALQWEIDQADNPPEASHLALDSTAAERELGWRPVWNLGEALRRFFEWHEAQRAGEDMRRFSLGQIEGFARPG